MKCNTCKDTGWYNYDWNHKKRCDACCKHNKGWWHLTEQFSSYKESEDNRCCMAGCGTMFRDWEGK